MKNATLRQLKVFEAVARLLSFSRAAEELSPDASRPSRYRSGSSKSTPGNALFEQFGKKIYLTPAGTELLQISRAIIQQFEAAENAMTQFKGVSGGKLNVGVISAGDYFFPRLLVEFAGRHSGVIAELHGSQPRRAARPHRRQPHRPRDHGAAADGPRRR